jgi:hypothetical protein
MTNPQRVRAATLVKGDWVNLGDIGWVRVHNRPEVYGEPGWIWLYWDGGDDGRPCLKVHRESHIERLPAHVTPPAASG